MRSQVRACGPSHDLSVLSQFCAFALAIRSMAEMRSVLLAAVAFCAIIAGVCNAQESNKVQHKKWTLAVYLNGDNSLSDFAVTNEEQMESVGSSDWLNIVVLLDLPTGCELHYVNKGNHTVLQSLGTYDTGDWKVSSLARLAGC